MEKQKTKNSDAIAEDHLRKIDEQYGNNVDVHKEYKGEHIADNPKIVEKSGKRILLDNTEAYGNTGNVDRFDFGNREKWIELPIGMLPSKGIFYPEGAGVLIKAAEVEEIKHWSTLDSNSFLDVDSKINYVLERCLKYINNSSKIDYLWKDILEIDRLYIIFRISELTFPGEINKLQMTFGCTSACKAPRGEQGQYKEKVIIGSQDLYLLELDEYLMQLYSKEHRCFVKTIKGGGDLKFYLPTTGVASRIKNLIVELREDGEIIDPFSVKVFPYIIKDSNSINASELMKLNVEIIGWSKNKVLFMSSLVDKIEDSVKLSVRHNCKKCSAVLEVPLFFRDKGIKIKDLFAVSDGLDDLI